MWAKLEGFNPSGSAKDRSAVAMVGRAIASGRITAGTTVVESSSGNFGVALARLAARHNFRLRCVVDPRTGSTTRAAIRALGGELEEVTEPDPTSGDWLVARLARVAALLAEDPELVWLDQYGNDAAIAAHARTFGEITDALDGAPDLLLVATSTTGTIGGCLWEARRRGVHTRVIAVDAEGSVLFGGQRGVRRLSGYGAGIVPALSRHLEPDGVERVSDRDAVLACWRLARTEGLLAGASAGAVTAAAERLLPDLPADARVALVFHDRGEAYLDTVYSEAWIAERLGIGAEELADRVQGGLLS